MLACCDRRIYYVGRYNVGRYNNLWLPSMHKPLLLFPSIYLEKHK